MRVAGYVRVSSAEQVEGFSLDAQRGAITRYCAGRAWGPIAWYEDAGVSGYTDDISKRPAFARLLADADAIVQTIAPELRSGDVVAILSNGGFGGIYEKLPARLKQLAEKQ